MTEKILPGVNRQITAKDDPVPSTPAAATDKDSSVAGVPQHISAPIGSEQRPADSLCLRQESLALADELINAFPSNPDALEVKARFCLLFGESENAAACWRSALKAAPQYAYATHGLGKVEMLNSNFEAAIELFLQAVSTLPANVELVHDLADAYTKLGQIDEAITTLSSFVAKYPESATTYLRLGQSYLANSQFELAEPAFRTALTLVPGLPRAEQGLATALLRLGKRDEAKELLTTQHARRTAEQTELSPQRTFDEELKACADRYCNAAEVYVGAGRFNHAERVIKRALVLSPNNSHASSVLVSVLRSQRRLAEAISVAQQQSKLAPNNSSWQFTIGFLASEMGDHADAQAAFREVVRLAPDSPVGYDSLVRTLIRAQSSLPETIKLATKLVQMRGTAADHELLGQSYAVNGDLNRAYQSLSEAIRLDPENQIYRGAMQHLKNAMGNQ